MEVPHEMSDLQSVQKKTRRETLIPTLRSVEIAVPMSDFDVLPDVLMSFCVAGVALCDIPYV